MKEIAKQTTEREQQEAQLSADYFQLKNNPAVLDLLSKLDMLIDMHTRVAIDQIGTDLHGKPLELTEPAKRLSHLDRAAGIEEVKLFLQRRLSPPQKKQSAD